MCLDGCRSDFELSSDAGVALAVEQFLLSLNSFPKRHIDGLSGAFKFIEGKRGGTRGGGGVLITCHVCEEKVMSTKMDEHMRLLHPEEGDDDASRRTGSKPKVCRCRVVSCRVVSCRVVSCRVVSCRVVSCRVVSCRVCHTMERARWTCMWLSPAVVVTAVVRLHAGACKSTQPYGVDASHAVRTRVHSGCKAAADTFQAVAGGKAQLV